MKVRQIEAGVFDLGDVFRQRAEVARASAVAVHLTACRAFTVFPARQTCHRFSGEPCGPRGISELMPETVHGGPASAANGEFHEAGEPLGERI